MAQPLTYDVSLPHDGRAARIVHHLAYSRQAHQLLWGEAFEHRNRLEELLHPPVGLGCIFGENRPEGAPIEPPERPGFCAAHRRSARSVVHQRELSKRLPCRVLLDTSQPF